MKQIQMSAVDEGHYFQEGYESSYSHVAIPLPQDSDKRNLTYLLASNTVSDMLVPESFCLASQTHVFSAALGYLGYHK